MNSKALRGSLRLMLLSATCLAATPALADDHSVDDRLDRLEALVEGLIKKLDAQEGATAQTAAEQQQMRAQGQALLATTQELRTRQTELETQVETASKKSDESGFKVGGTTVRLGGYVKMDAKTIRTSGGQLPGNSINRDFFIPSLVPIGGASSGWDTHFHSRQSRFVMKTATPVAGKTVGTHLELDFLVTAGGNQRVSSSYVPRMRQAFITYDGWTFGQAWSNFQNVGALPDSVDFVGTMPGTVFQRAPLIRYKSKSGFSVSLEQPETLITGATGGRLIPADDKLPDVTVRYDGKGITVAGIVRQLSASDNVLATGSDNAFGYGISVSGKVPIGTNGDDFRYMANVGSGVGRYMGANIVNDAALDANGNLDPITTYSGMAAFRKVWSPKARSSIAASYFKADNPTALTGTSPTDEVWNALANIVYSPVPKLDLGLEFMYAKRTNEAGASGNQQQLQVAAKYSF